MVAESSDHGQLKREIGLFDATALGIGAIIGSGIFIVTGIVAGVAGPAMIFSLIIAGIIALFSAMSIAGLSAYLPEEGGTYAYAQKLISPFAGFIAGWIWIFSNIFVGAAVSLGFAHYFIILAPSVPLKLIAIIICLIFILLNYIGLKESTLMNTVLVTLKILILIFFVVFGLGFFSPGHFIPLAPKGVTGIFGGAALIFFAYTGFGRVSLMAEEIQDPKKTIPHSIYLALGISTVLYILVSVIAVGLVGAPDLAQSGSPLADAIQVTGSSVAILLVSLGAMIATASVLLTTIMGISRIVFAMARNDDLPPFISRINRRFNTPHFAIWIPGLFMVAAVLFVDLSLAVTVSTFATLVFYFIANISALKIPEQYQRYPPVVPVTGAITCVGLIAFLTLNSWILGLTGLMSGIVWYAIRLRMK